MSRKVGYELVCDDQGTIKTTLRKAVLYGKGASIDLTSDLAENDNDDFVTLVVQLPSLFTGNTLTIHYDDDEKRVVQFDRENAEYELFYAGFYCKCKYEMTPLETGYRLVLVYRLTWRGMKNSLLHNLKLTQERIEQFSTKLTQVYVCLHCAPLISFFFCLTIGAIQISPF